MVKKNEYDWKITAFKAIKTFAMVGIPAGIIGMIPVIQEYATIDPQSAGVIALIVALFTALANWMKHKN